MRTFINLLAFTLMISVLTIITPSIAKAQQGVAINANGAAPANSAMLDITANNKEVLIQRMPLAKKIAIGSTAKGLLVFQTDLDSGFWYYTGSAWAKLLSSDMPSA